MYIPSFRPEGGWDTICGRGNSIRFFSVDWDFWLESDHTILKEVLVQGGIALLKLFCQRQPLVIETLTQVAAACFALV